MAIKIASGKTQAGYTNWQQYGTDGIFVDIDTSAAGFSKTPNYVASLHGLGFLWETTGGSEIYNAQKDRFRVFVRFVTDQPAPTPGQANSVDYSWHIVWIGVEE